MDVIFRHIRQVEVEDVRYGVDIDAAGGDVGGDQHAGAAGTKAGQGALALRLGFVAVNGGSLDAGSEQMPGDAIGAVLGAGEHQHALEARVAQHRRQELALALARHEDDVLLHPLHRGGGRRDHDLDRVVEVFLGQGGDRLRHRRREQQGLALARQQLHDPLQGVDEAEIEHPVGFVENQNLDARQHERAAVDQIEQAARGGDEDIDAGCEPALLRRKRNSAKHDRGRERQPAAIALEALRDLARQLAGRGEHQGAAASRRGALRALREELQHRQGKGGGLAGSGLRDAAEVSAGEHLRDGLRLDRRRRGVAFDGEGVEKRLDKSEI